MGGTPNTPAAASFQYSSRDPGSITATANGSCASTRVGQAGCHARPSARNRLRQHQASRQSIWCIGCPRLPHVSLLFMPYDLVPKLSLRTYRSVNAGTFYCQSPGATAGRGRRGQA